MPHKCTKCEQIFIDGDADILNGCPNCGWNKFLYVGNRATQDKGTKEAVGADKTDTKMATGVKEIDDMLCVEKTTIKPAPRQDRGPRVESIRILEKGSYELNIDALMNRKEIVMAMKEEGSYIMHLPSMFEDLSKGKKSKKGRKK